jgi:TonB family protein
MRTSIAWMFLASSLGAGGSHPARLTASDRPTNLSSLHDQCQVALDVGVDPTGSVSGVWCLYGSALVADRLGEAVSRWAFEPATEGGDQSASRVLVAALFRPSTLFNVGPCEPPDSMLPAPEGLPIPVIVVPPAYPVHALGGGTVVVEVEIGPSGDVRSTRVIGEPTGFDGAAAQAAQLWHFRPARRQGQPVPTVAYLVFGFQEPALSTGRH